MSRRVASPELVDRADALAVLSVAWDEAVSGTPRTVLVEGEAGIGKTRLVDDLAALVATSGGVVARGACLQLGGGTLPLVAFRSVVGDLRAAVGEPAVQEVARPGATSLSPLLGAAADAPRGEAANSGALFDAVARLVHHAAATSPVMLVVEDLHWSDASTRDLVSYLCHSLPTSPVLVIATVRTGPGAEPAVAESVDELARLGRVERLVLHRLTPAGVVRQMAGILGAPPDAVFAELVVRRSAGVPFLVEELTAAGGVDAGAVPEALRQLVLRRTSSLSAGATAALRAVAAAGGPVDERTIAYVSELPESALDPVLRELVDRDLLVVDRRLGRYDVRHALLREAVDEDLLPGQAAHLHERHALLLDRSGETDGRSVIEAAHHWWVAKKPDRAYPAALRAAAAARAFSAYSEELVLLQRCLALWGPAGPPGGDSGPDRVDLLAAAGRAARLAGRYETSRELLEQARSVLSAADPPLRAAQVLFEEALLLRSLGEMPGIEDALRSLLDSLTAVSTAARAHALNALVQLQLHDRRDLPELRRTVELAAEAAATAGEPTLAAHLQVTQSALVADDSERPDLAPALLDSAWDVGERLGDAALMLRVLDGRAGLLVSRGQFVEAEATARRGLLLAAERGSSVLMRDYLSGGRCDALLALGEWEEAAALLDEALLVDRPNLERAGLYARRAAVRTAVGDLAGARAAVETGRTRLERGTADSSLLVLLAIVEAELALAEGRPTEAAEVARVATVEHGHQVTSAARWRLLRVAAAATVAARRPAASADGPPAWLYEAVTQQSAAGPGSPWAAVVSAELAGDDAELWRRAAAVCPDRTFPVLVRLQVLARAAGVCLSDGARAEAAGLLGEVIVTARRLGAVGLLRDAGDLAARARLRVAGTEGAQGAEGALDPAQAGSSGPDQLTPRELEVLRLLAVGRSNAQIADRLVISTKTVSVHVSHILAKLGVASRGEAAATARARGLSASPPHPSPHRPPPSR